MELRSTREMRRNEQLNKALAKKAEVSGSSASAQAQPPLKKAPADKLSLSRQALAFLEEQNRQAMEREQRRQSRMNDSLSSMESAKSELDAMGKKLKVMSKCQKIAASIMKGDRVPPEDLEYLMNNDPDGYKLAMAMRRHKKDPEDCESVLDEEDRNGGGETSDNGEVPAGDAPVSTE